MDKIKRTWISLKFSFHGKEYNMKNTLIISAYTCCGKTYASEHMKNYDILDVDIRKFKTIKRLPNEEEIEKERQWWESSLHLMSTEAHLNHFKQQIISVDNPNFPDNFIQYIKENIGKVDVIFIDSDHDSRCTVFCVNDVNDKLNKNYIESPNEYHYQKVDVLDVKKILGE